MSAIIGGAVGVVVAAVLLTILGMKGRLKACKRGGSPSDPVAVAEPSGDGSAPPVSTTFP